MNLFNWAEVRQFEGGMKQEKAFNHQQSQAHQQQVPDVELLGLRSGTLMHTNHWQVPILVLGQNDSHDLKNLDDFPF